MKNRHLCLSSIPSPFYALLLRWLLSLTIVTVALFMFLELAEDVWVKEGFSWDAPLMSAIHSFSTPWLDLVMKGITFSAGRIVFILTAGIALWLWHGQMRKMDAVMLILTVLSLYAVSTLFKSVFARPRPDIFVPLYVELGYSFPSGHTSMAAGLYGSVAALLWRAHHRGLALLSGGWVLAVALSRVYLGLHHPSDVLGSLMLGVLWFSVVIIIYDKYQRGFSE